MNTPPPLLDIRNLHVEYLTQRGPVRAVNGVSFTIDEGEVFGLAGESACGKSTIAHTILRVLRPPAVITGGEILYKGMDVLEMGDRDVIGRNGNGNKDETTQLYSLESFRWSEVSMVFQSAMNSLNPVIRVGEQITDVIVKHQGVDKAQARKRAEELMDIINIERQRLDAYPHELSGGMRQRMVIAIALALEPSLMIMDEPTTALDVVVQKDILQEIDRLKNELGFSILFITHDLSLMVETSDRIAIMYAGEIVEIATAEEIFNESQHPYTKGLLSAFPSITGPRDKLSGIAGAPPNLLNPPTGCRFHPRCQFYDKLDRDSPPPLIEVSPGHLVACDCRTRPTQNS